jgi:plasmid stabilization system protein ParE
MTSTKNIDNVVANRISSHRQSGDGRINRVVRESARQMGLELAFEIDRILERISQSPEQFPHIRGHIRRALLRRFPYGIHFITETDRVVVLAVFHVKRNPRLLEER